MNRVRKYYRNWKPSEIYDACKLCLVTSDAWLDGRSLHACVAESIIGGVTLVQLRMKGENAVHVARVARDIMPVCRIANVPFVVFNDIDAAKVAGADGVHIYDDSISCESVRSELGEGAIVGFSVNTVEEAIPAQEEGATYLEVGPIFDNANTERDSIVDLGMVKAISDAVDIPVLAIGGVNPGNVSDLRGTDVAGVSCMSAILASPDIEMAASKLSSEVDSYLRSSVAI